MKKRVKTDSAILSLIIILTGFSFALGKFDPPSPFLDDTLDFIGIFVLFTGVMLRMSARGHKKAHSKQGQKLVMTGPYTLVRNPMYLGSFLMGAGFIFMVWPWWSLPLFAWLFYARFNKQIVKEEKQLTKLAGDKYKKYCQRIHRFFPSFHLLPKARLRKIVNVKESLSTQEARGLWMWPFLAVVLESFQEMIVFEETIISQTVTIFVTGAIVFAVVFWILYQKK